MPKQQSLSETIAAYRKAIQDNPNRADLYTNLGVYLQQAGDLEGAVQSFQRALTLDRNSYSAYNNLGNLFASLGDRQTALTFLKAAAQLSPNVADIHNNIANICFEQEETRAAIESYRKAIALRPNVPSYYNHLGNALRLEEKWSEAEESFRRALSLHPEYPEAHANLGFLFFEQQQIETAEEYYRRAIELDPDFAMAHACIAQILLRRGEFAAGWKEQEWRWQWKGFPSPKRNFSQPQWRGEEIHGAKIFLHAEQGFGDTLQFLRYVPMVAERGAKVILEVHPELTRLVEDLDGVEQLISRGEPIPNFDWHSPLMSLPLAFDTDLATIPARIPYLRSKLEAPDWLSGERIRNFRVGLVWAGNPQNRIDRKRSLTLSSLAPLFDVAEVSLYSLQRGPAMQEIETAFFSFAGFLPSAGDFAETAAVITHLDLIITVDSAVAHLAGSLGKRVWILLPKISDWRWLIDREDSPWYPTARLFRQEVAGRWESVIEKVTAELPRAVKAQQIVSRK